MCSLHRDHGRNLCNLHENADVLKTMAIDASMCMYQFLIATQTFSMGRSGVGELTDTDGNLTGHLVGIFHRTIQLMENGIKPIWVFDGKAPDMKGDELEKRKALK